MQSHVQLYRPPGHYAIINRWSQVDKAFSLTLTIPWHKRSGTESKRREEVSVINKVHKVLTSQAPLQFSASKGDWTLCLLKGHRVVTHNKQIRLQSPLSLSSGEQGWCSGESTSPSPIRPEFNSRLVAYAGLVCCWFLPSFKGFPPGSSVFLPPQKPTYPHSNLTMTEDLHENQPRLMWLPLQILNICK